MNETRTKGKFEQTSFDDICRTHLSAIAKFDERANLVQQTGQTKLLVASSWIQHQQRSQKQQAKDVHKTKQGRSQKQAKGENMLNLLLACGDALTHSCEKKPELSSIRESKSRAREQNEFSYSERSVGLFTIFG